MLGPGKAQTAAEMMNGLLEAPAAPTLADVGGEKAGAEGQADQRGAVSRQIRHHLYAADPRLYRRRLLGFATAAEQVGFSC